MKRFLLVGAVFSVLLTTVIAQNQAGPEIQIMDEGPEAALTYQLTDIEWQPGPASFESGAEYAVLEGSPGEPGFFNLRIRMPDGFHIAPHWHPNVERVTVISGTFRIGHGEDPNPETTQALGPGSYFSFPPEHIHYAYAEGETVIQLTSIGPWVIHYINPEDDPR
jgi:quercetin dioxygenase-like cupin family protein